MIKQEFEIKPQAMSYDNQELTIETSHHIFQIKDKRVICVLADRLTELKKQINSSKTQANPKDLSANENFTAQSVSPKVCPCDCHKRIGNGRKFMLVTCSCDCDKGKPS